MIHEQFRSYSGPRVRALIREVGGGNREVGTGKELFLGFGSSIQEPAVTREAVIGLVILDGK
ncbi:MAG: hypothetical protein JWM93_2467 [Frankiales bacterium]|nr:hypothetical protein [Frankiales bacterium]